VVRVIGREIDQSQGPYQPRILPHRSIVWYIWNPCGIWNTILAVRFKNVCASDNTASVGSTCAPHLAKSNSLVPLEHFVWSGITNLCIALSVVYKRYSYCEMHDLLCASVSRRSDHSWWYYSIYFSQSRQHYASPICSYSLVVMISWCMLCHLLVTSESNKSKAISPSGTLWFGSDWHWCVSLH
jgi:hypothetical protein